MDSKIILGYSLTDCYSGNANFHGQQKQYIIINADGQIRNIFLKGFVNGPADDGRYRMVHTIAELPIDDYNVLVNASDFHKSIIWNTGKYSIYTNHLPEKKYREIKKAAAAYVKTLIDICEPFNISESKKAKRKIKSVLKKYLSKADYKNCDNFIYMF